MCVYWRVATGHGSVVNYVRLVEVRSLLYHTPATSPPSGVPSYFQARPMQHAAAVKTFLDFYFRYWKNNVIRRTNFEQNIYKTF